MTKPERSASAIVYRAVAIAFATALLTACPPPPCPSCVQDTGAAVDAAADDDVPRPLPTHRLDLLLAIDNSMSMRENQSNFVEQFGPMLDGLTRAGVTDIQVGVVSSDLGTPGSSVPGCANSDAGDDGLLNPIRYGQSEQRHLPWLSAPAGFRPDDCNRTDQFPAFIAFDARVTEPTRFVHDMHCNAALYIGGCGLEQQLESVWRALIWHDAGSHPDNTGMNARFIRDDALLAIIVLSDEEDGSVRDCRYARGQPCEDALDIFNASSNRWASANLNLRGYMYQPGSSQDPAWNLDRYIDPLDASKALLGLKPGHPERLIFAAITGVPIALPSTGAGADRRIAWDRLVGAPGPDANDFYARNTSTSIDEMSDEGPISMRQANADATCAERVVPACRRQGTAYDPARPPCTTTDQYFAWPARRIVEVARRFDESRLCGGSACRNGLVSSICANDLLSAVGEITGRIGERAAGR